MTQMSTDLRKSATSADYSNRIRPSPSFRSFDNEHIAVVEAVEEEALGPDPVTSEQVAGFGRQLSGDVQEEARRQVGEDSPLRLCLCRRDTLGGLDLTN